ncbi:MAG: polysaccharide biosynthesis/export family protein [Desulfobacterales bacterium]|nr:polysaccharide biosynthesis/export family protein [Desulfobacterales bacterium]
MALMLCFQMVTVCVAQSTPYHVGPRDVLSLTISAGGEKQTQVDLTVSSAGTINMPFIGAVTVEGLTASQVEAKIREPLARDYFVDPEIIVSIRGYHHLRYNIAGAVKLPGLYESNAKMTVMELIAKAGGVTENRGSVAYILRSGEELPASDQAMEKMAGQAEPIRIDLQKLLDRGDMTQNRELQSGDSVYIPGEKTQNPTESKIYLEGEIRTGVISYRPGLTALNACIMAGGFSKFAAPNRAKIFRKEGDKIVSIEVDLDDVKEGKIPDMELMPGDRIQIPKSWF